MAIIKGLTWDHPRGFNALDAASRLPEVQDAGLDIVWDKQPLEGFESHPIADLCARYDLVVIDHPHVGEAVASNCLVPLEEVFDTGTLGELAAEAIGPSMASYAYAGRHWALPLDAATQVMAVRPDLLDIDIPREWYEVVTFAERTGKVAISLAGPHAALSFLSICAALGEAPAQQHPDVLILDMIGAQAFDLLARLGRKSPPSAAGKNPIGILAHMAMEADIALCPLIYGYVNYAAPQSGQPVAFHNVPRVVGGRLGSTLGGTGIGISRRCALTDELKAHLLWLMSADAQTSFIPAHDGQPSRRDAWADDCVNARWGNFYRDTTDTLEAAYVRPRFNGYVAFQTAASEFLREAIADRRDPRAVISDLNALYAAHHADDAPV